MISEWRVSMNAKREADLEERFGLNSILRIYEA